MAIDTISQLRTWFTALKKPTQAQFWAVFESFAHRSRDFDQMGGGLKPVNPSRPYTAGEAAIADGKIRVANYNLPAEVYNAAHWTDFTGNPASLGIPAYDPEEDVETGFQRTHRNAIYEATDDSLGIEPGVDPDWATVWVVVVYTEGGLIPVRINGFVKDQTVYEATGADTPNGLYRANHVAAGFDGGFKSTDFATELAAGWWLLVSLKSGGGSQTLQEVSDTGGLDNGSTLREGSRDNGFGGGISRVCAADKEDQWEDGVRYYFPVGGSIVYAESMNDVIPDADYDNTKGWAVGSRFTNLVTGITYKATDVSPGAAVWVAPLRYQTISLVDWTALVAASGLIPGSFYLVTAAYSSTLYGVDWDVLVLANSVNTVQGTAWVRDDSNGISNEYLKCITETTFSDLILVETSIGLALIPNQISDIGAISAQYARGTEIFIKPTTPDDITIQAQVSSNPGTLVLTNCKSISPAGDVLGQFGTYTPETASAAADDLFTPHVATTEFIATAPTSTDDSSKGYRLGSRLIAQDTQIEYLCTDATTGAAVWDALPSASNCIPLSGTTEGNPVSGPVKFGDSEFGSSRVTGSDSSISIRADSAGDPSGRVVVSTGSIELKIIDADNDSQILMLPNSIRINGDLDSFAGIEELSDFSANYTDLSLTNKGYVDGKLAGGATGSFTTVDSKTVTVVNGLITSIV